jgi:hypothetical protein
MVVRYLKFLRGEVEEHHIRVQIIGSRLEPPDRSVADVSDRIPLLAARALPSHFKDPQQEPRRCSPVRVCGCTSGGRRCRHCKGCEAVPFEPTPLIAGQCHERIDLDVRP